MQPLLVVATLVGALAVAVNSETAYILAPVRSGGGRVLSTGWGWGPVKTVSLALPSIVRGGGGWGWKPRQKLSGVSIGVYGGIRIGQKQQGWGQQQQGWGWQQKQHGWGGWGQQQQGWGWQKPQGWGWQKQQHGWGWDDDDDEDDYRSVALYDDADDDDSSEEVQDDDASSSVESEEADESAEADSPLDLRHAIGYEPYYA